MRKNWIRLFFFFFFYMGREKNSPTHVARGETVPFLLLLRAPHQRVVFFDAFVVSAKMWWWWWWWYRYGEECDDAHSLLVVV